MKNLPRIIGATLAAYLVGGIVLYVLELYSKGSKTVNLIFLVISPIAVVLWVVWGAKPIPATFSERITKSIFLKIILVIIFLTFIAGAAFNDGWSRWIFGLPFLGLLYCVLPSNRINKIFICTTFILMVIVGHYKYQWSWVYLFVGQDILLHEDITVVTEDNYSMYTPDPSQYDGAYYKQVKLHIIPKGSIIHIAKVEVSNIDLLEIHHSLVGTNGNFMFSLALVNDSFCEKNQWEYCKQIRQLPKTYGAADMMRKSFRNLSKLMYYPSLPFRVVLNSI